MNSFKHNTKQSYNSKTIEQLLCQLSRVWQSVDRLSDYDYFNKSNNLLIQLLECIHTRKVKKPDWRSIYYKNLSVAINLKNVLMSISQTNFALYYFRLVSILSSELCLSRLLSFISQTNSQQAISKNHFNIKQFKINYFNDKYDEKNFDFIEKIVVKFCKIIPEILNCYEDRQQLIKHYLIGLTNVDNVLKLKLKRIILAAFDSYCRLCYRNINIISSLKLNVFQIMNKLLDLFQNSEKTQQDYAQLYNLFIAFTILISTPPVINYVKQFYTVLNVFETIRRFIKATLAFQNQSKSLKFKEIIQTLCVCMLQSHGSRYFFDLTQNVRNMVKVSCFMNSLIYLLWFHNQILNFKIGGEFKYYAQLFYEFQMNCQYHFNLFSQQKIHQIIHICIIDLNNFVRNEVFKLIRNYDIVNPQTLTVSQMEIVIRFLPLYKLMISLLKKSYFKKNFQKIQIFYYQIIVYCLIFGYLMNPNQKTLRALFNFIAQQYSIIYSLNNSPLSLLKLFHTFNRLSGSKHSLMAFKCINKLITHINIKNLLFQPKTPSMFKVIRIMTRQFGQCLNCKTNNCLNCKQRSIFISKIIHLQMKNIISAIQSLSHQQKQDNRKLFLIILAEMMGNLIYYFHVMEDDSRQQLCQLLVRQGMRGFTYIFAQISEAIKNEMFFILQITDFYKNHLQKQVLRNCISLFKIIYQKKQHLTEQDKVKLIDCLFNVKHEMGILNSKLKRQKLNELYQDMQLIIDQIYALQYNLLEKPAQDYINHLSHLLEERANINFSFLVSVALKNIYFLLYSGIPIVAQTSSEHDYNINSQDSLNEYYFFENELEEMATKVKIIKQRCKQLQIVFYKFGFKNRQFIFSTQLCLYQINLQDVQSVRNICCQLNDMIYVSHLCGLNTFKELLISYRLSLIFKLTNQSIYLIQLAKLILFQILPQSEQLHLKEELLKITKTSSILPDCYRGVINLILNDEVKMDVFDQKRIFKIIYLLNNSPLLYINNIKSILSYLSSNIFSFLSFPFQPSAQYNFLKMSSRINNYQTSDQQYWIKHVWEQGWPYLRLMILFIKRILKQSIQLNELSRIKSFIKFSTVILIRSAHLEELALPLKILMEKEKQINLLKIADSLRKIVCSQINASQYRKLDRILCNKRKSLSCGMNFEGLTKSISIAFKNAGNIGIVLCEIFMMIISQTLRVNQWDKFVIRSKMEIYQNDTLKNFEIQTQRLLLRKDRQIDEKILENKIIARRITQKLFQNYSEAVVLKQYIAQFINNAIDHYQSLSRFQNIQIEKIVVLLAVSFQQFNFTIKQFWSKNVYPLSLNEATLKSLSERKNHLLRAFNDLKNTYQGRIQNKISDMKTLKFPLSMLFPIGKYLFNLAWKDSFLMTVVPLSQFQDKVFEIKGIISSNNGILMSKQLNSMVNYRKRKGLDNQMGKILSGVDIGIVDQDLSKFPSSILSELTSIHQALPKFLISNNKNAIKHLRYFIKRLKISNEEGLVIKFEDIFSRMNQIHFSETNKQMQNILLYIHYKYLQFPFEAIKSLFQQKGVFRIPSIEYMLTQQTIDKRYNINQCKYLINTKNDLPQTEIKFQSIKKRFPRWIGVKGRIPPLHQVIHLFDRDIFLFMGHGNGLDHIPSSQFINFNPTCLMLVFGCSSAQMIFQSSEPYGCSFDFLLRGCPAYLGCLWNVTDIDIDKITIDLFSRQSNCSLSYLLSQSKLKCSYPYLNGSALVVYGLPCTVYNSNDFKKEK